MSQWNFEHHVSALIVASPGRMRDGLKALLRNVPRIKTIFQANDSASSLQILAQQHPALVLLDSKIIHTDIRMTLKRIKAVSPQTRCIVLADTFEHQWMARVAGADSVLLAGYSAEMLFATVEGILSWPETQAENTNRRRLDKTIPANERCLEEVKPLRRPSGWIKERKSDSR